VRAPDRATQRRPDRDVYVLGVGLHRFGRFADKTIHQMSQDAVREALRDAGMRLSAVQVAYFGHVYYQGMSVGEEVLAGLALTGIPVINVENACSSGSTGFWQAYWNVAAGVFDVALAFGAEKVPKGAVTTRAAESYVRLTGGDHMMASYGLRMRRYMHEHGAPLESIAQVSVKAHHNATRNPYAQHPTELSLADVLNSRLIADPVTLYQCCPTSEGAAAAILCSREVAQRYDADLKRCVRVAGASLRVQPFQDRHVDNPHVTTLAAREAFQMADMTPADMDLCQVHDASAVGELIQIEALGLVPEGQAWRYTVDGRTSLDGDIPVNSDGGLLAIGHPFGATGIRMITELVTQIRGEAGSRQVKKARAGIAQCSGWGGVSTVHILAK
jgi:acetyl-CoA acetyltransferase